MRLRPSLFRLVALLLLAWILGDTVGAGLCPGEVDPCAGSAPDGCAQAGLPHGQHSGMVTLHAGHCLAHGLVTLARHTAIAPTLEVLTDEAGSSVWRTTPGVHSPIDHPPQLAA